MISLALASLLPCRLTSQAIIEFSLPGGKGQPTGITTGPDGNLWVIDWLKGVDRMTTAGVVTQYTAPFGEASSIATGPDGALWVAQWTANKIGHMTTAGVWTDFSPPTASSGPQTIVAGPDGAMWFTERAGKIGRITTAGVVTAEYPIPTASGQPEGLTVGPDGAFWFTETDSRKIGRMTTAGVVTNEYLVPNGHVPSNIVSGPDGNLWFTESGGIGRITTSGVITEFPLPAGTGLISIAAGPDGNLWFPEFYNEKIGRITPAGEITEFTIPTSNSGPYGITTGPDGNLWFTEFNSAKVAMLRPPAATPGARLYPLVPCRLVDTRSGDGPDGGPALVGGTNRLFRLAGCGIPSTARAVAANLTVTQGSAGGSLTIYPVDVENPGTSSINYRAGQTRANNVILTLGTNSSIFVRCAQPSGAVHFILDVSGYFQ